MRLILDTMLWGYVGQTGSREKLERCAKAHGWRICTPPATLLETFRDTNSERRTAGIRALLSPHWVRLCTEADMECLEVVTEAKRVRPGWVRQIPLPDRMALFRSPGREVRDHEEDILIDMMKLNRAERRHIKGGSWRLDGLTLKPRSETPADYLYGWDGGVPIEPWRLLGRDHMVHGLRNRLWIDRPDVDSTIADWLDPYLHLDRVLKNKDDYGRFWIFDVDKGNGFYRALERVKEASPIPFADFRRVKVHPDDSMIVEIIESCSS